MTLKLMWWGIQLKELAGIQGFEPRPAESESAVLPLDDIPNNFKIYILPYDLVRDRFYFYVSHIPNIFCFLLDVFGFLSFVLCL